MSTGDWVYIGQSINPIAGLLASVPWAILKLHYPLWVVIVSGPPLAYVQVIVADLLYSALRRLSYVNRLLEKKRSPWVEKLLASNGSFLTVFIATPLVGPWLVILVMRYANIGQRQVAIPILLALTFVALSIGVLCTTLPSFFS